MRTAFSMNDLQVGSNGICLCVCIAPPACDESLLTQTLQVYEAEAPSGTSGASWNPRLVSRGHARKPSLASVPEGGMVEAQPAVNLMPMASSGYPQPMDGFTYMGRQGQQAGPSSMMPVQAMHHHPVGIIPPGHQVFSQPYGQQVSH